MLMSEILDSDWSIQALGFQIFMFNEFHTQQFKSLFHIHVLIYFIKYFPINTLNYKAFLQGPFLLN